MRYEEQLEKMSEFLKVLDRASEPEEFMLTCTLDGIGYMASREFFEQALYKFMYEPVSNRGQILKMRMRLLDRLPFLVRVYEILPECYDPDTLRDLTGAQLSVGYVE